MHRNSQLIFGQFCLPYFLGASDVLEVGPGASRRGRWYEIRAKAEGNDPHWHVADIKDTGRDAPLSWHMPSDEVIMCPDSHFDVVFSAQVLEHVRRPWRWVTELVRVLRPGGHIMLISPITWGYHRAPVDCWRVLKDGARVLLEDAGCQVVVAEHLSLDMSGENDAAQINPGPPMDLLSIGEKN